MNTQVVELTVDAFGGFLSKVVFITEKARVAEKVVEKENVHTKVLQIAINTVKTT